MNPATTIGKRAAKLFFAAAAALFMAVNHAPVRADDSVCVAVKGAAVVAQDGENTFLGKVDNKYSSESIFNKFGTFGSRFSSQSIWNKFSTFGGSYGLHSPHNKFSAEPPMLIKRGKVIGYLSANKTITPSISPNLLKALCEDIL